MEGRKEVAGDLQACLTSAGSKHILHLREGGSVNHQMKPVRCNVYMRFQIIEGTLIKDYIPKPI